MAKHPLQSALEHMGMEVRSYSGRGMYGKECLAIVTDYHPIRLGFILKDYHVDSITEEMLTSTRSDNMGHSIVYYWPDIPYTD